MAGTIAEKKRILIACSMIEDELNQVVDEYHLSDLEIRWMERGHHNDPEKLHRVLQQEIDLAEADEPSAVLLAYGLCGNGAVGLRAQSCRLVLPRFDDCVNMMLCTGYRDRRNYLETGQMYLTRGWMHDEGALLGMLDRYKAKYGEKKGRRVMKLMLDSYDKVTVIEDGCYPLGPVLEYADACAWELDLEVRRVPGSNQVMRKLLTGEWDSDILVKEPGEPVREEDFEWPAR